MKYQCTVTEIGELAEEMMDGGLLILFGENAPAELKEIAVVHTDDKLKDEIRVNDTVEIGSMKYEVIAIGDEANRTFESIGHCTLKFDNVPEVELPGQVTLKGDGVPAVKIGDLIKIY